MPELPEIETVLRAIQNKIEKETIHSIQIRTPKLRWEIQNNLNELIKNHKIIHVFRRSKYLILELEHQQFLLLHFGMSGSLKLLKNHEIPEIKKHEHFDLITENYCLRYRDPRKFGALIYAKTDNIFNHALLKNLGIEPLNNSFDAHYLFTISRRKKTEIKPFIMNAHYIVGVGNIYASEALFYAQIHPKLPAQLLTFNQCERLVDSIKTILFNAIQAGGSTLKDFYQPNGESAYFQFEHAVYNREHLNCFICKTPIKKIKQSQRSSFYCPHCQPLPKSILSI